MTKRFLLLLVGLVILTTLLVISQLRPEPARVSGFLEADEIRLGSRVGGRVARVYVQEGDRVQADDPLVELEPFDLRHREQQMVALIAECQAEVDRLHAGYLEQEIAQAQARVENWQAELELLQNGPRPKEIEAAEARLQVALAQKELAEQTFQRRRELHDRRALSDSDIEVATENLKVAQNQHRVREKELELLIEGTRFEEIQRVQAQRREAQAAWQLMRQGYRQEEIRKAEAALAAAQAQREAVRAQLAELTIRAPIDATVEAVDLQPGDLVAAGAPVLSLIDRRHLWVRAYVPGGWDVRVDQRVLVTVDGRPGLPIPAQVVYRARQAEFTPSNVQTVDERSQQVFRIKVDSGPPTGLWPGMTADVWFSKPDEAKRMNDIARRCPGLCRPFGDVGGRRSTSTSRSSEGRSSACSGPTAAASRPSSACCAAFSNRRRRRRQRAGLRRPTRGGADQATDRLHVAEIQPL